MNECKFEEKDAESGIYQSPDPNCVANPFITNAFYEGDKACMTRYQALNNRNYRNEWMAAFIVVAESHEDIQKSINFAKKYNIGVSVINTGHELLDRNAGPGPNTLMIRTTCFRDWIPNLNDSIEDANGHNWTDGYADVGAGLSFGTNFWNKIKNAEGLYRLSANVSREIVGGSCESVGILGWMIGGGRGLTSPFYGLGVDQLISAKLIDGNGNNVTANATNEHKDIFFAIKGGGYGFGVIYSIRIKLHKPRCKQLIGLDPLNVVPTMENCYIQHKAQWLGHYERDLTPEYVKNITKHYLTWSNESRPNYNSVLALKYTDGNYSLSIFGTSFGQEDPHPFKKAFEEFQKDRIYFDKNTGEHTTSTEDRTDVWNITTSKYFCEKFPNYPSDSNCTFRQWHLERWLGSVRFLLDKSILNNSFVDDLIKSWQPCCDENNYAACISGIYLTGDLPDENVQVTESALSPGFRKAYWQVFNGNVNSNNVNMTDKQKDEWLHATFAPRMYKYSTSSYFNEAEYTLDPGQWERRFWGEENHCKLLEHKRKYDPDQVFGCRHCVGNEDGPL